MSSTTRPSPFQTAAWVSRTIGAIKLYQQFGGWRRTPKIRRAPLEDLRAVAATMSGKSDHYRKISASPEFQPDVRGNESPLHHQSRCRARMAAAAASAVAESANRPKHVPPLPDKRASAHPSDLASSASTSSIIGDTVQRQLRGRWHSLEGSDEGIETDRPHQAAPSEKTSSRAANTEGVATASPPFTRTTAQGGNGLTGVTVPRYRSYGRVARDADRYVGSDRQPHLRKPRIVDIEMPKPRQDAQRSRCVRRTAAKSGRHRQVFRKGQHCTGTGSGRIPQQSRCPKDQIIGISIVQPRGKRSIDAQRQIVAGLGDQAITVFREAHQTVQQMVTVVAAPADVKEEAILAGASRVMRGSFSGTRVQLSFSPLSDIVRPRSNLSSMAEIWSSSGLRIKARCH